MVDSVSEFAWHIRHHRLGRVKAGRLEFDWNRLFARRLVLVPNYEHNARPVFEAARELAGVQLFRYGEPPACVPDLSEIDFFVEIDSAITSLVDEARQIVYVSFFTEEAYLAVTPETAELVFAESAFDLLARSFARAVSQETIRMRRHQHGLRIYYEALKHLDRFETAVRPNSVLL